MTSADCETRILIEACRPGQSPAGSPICAPEADINWHRLVRYSVRHSVLPLLYLRLHQAGSAIPAETLESLTVLYRQHVVHCLRLSAELVELIRLLRQKGIDCIPLKGPVLAEGLYRDCTARQFSDLDILVRREQAVELYEILVSTGFCPSHLYSPRQLNQHLKRTCEVTFTLPDNGVLLDVHWRVMARYVGADLDTRELFEAKRTILFQGEEISTLSDEHYLLYLAIHGAFHRWDHLVWIVDFAAMAARFRDADWAAIVRQAARCGIRRMLLTALAVAAELEYLPLAPEIQALVERDSAATRLAARVTRDLFQPNEPTFRNTNQFLLAAQQSLTRKLRFCGTRAFIPTVADWHWLNLPDRLYFLYYLLRPVRILNDYRKQTRLLRN
ncbi:MAG: nucleotidyltransferase family protein [Acidobacteriota bacterium]